MTITPCSDSDHSHLEEMVLSETLWTGVADDGVFQVIEVLVLLDYTQQHSDKASLKFTTSNLYHMESSNGDHRLAKAISFLINRINSAMLNHNDSDKNS